jgi:hypothetical protein
VTLKAHKATRQGAWGFIRNPFVGRTPALVGVLFENDELSRR